MSKFTRIVQIIFGVPWIIFGIQHFLYADFVAQIVPAYFPAQPFWVYLTGAAMIAAGVSFIVNRKASLAAALVGLMILSFIPLIHVSLISKDVSSVKPWLRLLQDVAILLSAFLLADLAAQADNDSSAPPSDFLRKIAAPCVYLLALVLILFGIQEFRSFEIAAVKIPAFLPLTAFWGYAVGAALIAAGASILFDKKSRHAVVFLGALLAFLNVLFHGYQLATAWQNPGNWTTAMIDLTIVCGVFFLAEAILSKDKSSRAV